MNKKQLLRRRIYDKYNGHCAYCGKRIEYKNMQVDHIIPICRGGKDVEENKNPSCRRCNHYKRSEDIVGFRRLMNTLHERLLKIYIVKVAIDYEIVKIYPFGGFYFEKQDKLSPAAPVSTNVKTVGDNENEQG